MSVTFKHESGFPVYEVLGYFAADGKAGESSADGGTKWRAHFVPDQVGRWMYTVHFSSGKNAAFDSASGVHGSLTMESRGAFGGAINENWSRFSSSWSIEVCWQALSSICRNKRIFLEGWGRLARDSIGLEDFDNTVAGKGPKALEIL